MKVLSNCSYHETNYIYAHYYSSKVYDSIRYPESALTIIPNHEMPTTRVLSEQRKQLIGLLTNQSQKYSFEWVFQPHLKHISDNHSFQQPYLTAIDSVIVLDSISSSFNAKSHSKLACMDYVSTVDQIANTFEEVSKLEV